MLTFRREASKGRLRSIRGQSAQTPQQRAAAPNTWIGCRVTALGGPRTRGGAALYSSRLETDVVDSRAPARTVRRLMDELQ